jgi:XTP/dITP diphosphohydrolase
MNTPSAPVTLLLATRNAHKAGEIRVILGERFQYLTLKDFPQAPEVVEDADTFAANATKKAIELAASLSQVQSLKSKVAAAGAVFVLADDSGLEVDALGGKPGVHSARFAALDAGGTGNSPDVENNAKLLRLLQDVPAERRTARFRCVLALVATTPGPTQLFEGVCEGRIDFAPHGAKGFGYDPLFIPNGYAVSFAELGVAVKNQLSHRAQALKNLRTTWVASVK